MLTPTSENCSIADEGDHGDSSLSEETDFEDEDQDHEGDSGLRSGDPPSDEMFGLASKENEIVFRDTAAHTSSPRGPGMLDDNGAVPLLVPGLQPSVSGNAVKDDDHCSLDSQYTSSVVSVGSMLGGTPVLQMQSHPVDLVPGVSFSCLNPDIMPLTTHDSLSLPITLQPLENTMQVPETVTQDEMSVPEPATPQSPSPVTSGNEPSEASAQPKVSNEMPPPAPAAPGDKKKKKKKDEVAYSDIKIKETIGQGSFGKVFRADLWGQEVAVKELRFDRFLVKTGSLADSIKQFKKEVKIMRTLRHPNVVEFLGACVMQPNLCIITEYLPKGSLEELMERIGKKNKKLSTRRIINFSKDIARGLNWLHHKGIIHRDLKTANILIDDNSKAKLADFGLSHVRRRKGDASGGLYGVCGTPCYMAPEVLSKAPYSISADVFSFGIVLCEMIMGQYPYENEPESTATFEQAIVMGLRPKVPRPPLCPAILSDLIERCWQESPDMRPSVDEIMRTLDTIEFSENSTSLLEDLPLADDVQEKVAALFAESTKRCEELTSEISNKDKELLDTRREMQKIVKQMERQKAALEKSQKKLKEKSTEASQYKRDLTKVKREKVSKKPEKTGGKKGSSGGGGAPKGNAEKSGVGKKNSGGGSGVPPKAPVSLKLKKMARNGEPTEARVSKRPRIPSLAEVPRRRSITNLSEADSASSGPAPTTTKKGREVKMPNKFKQTDER